ncbi:MAG: DUF423 domain-containing protein [Saprospiraceae bacterium]|nr:DUF423 domain-containing protein [Saprospiraceae bacterium]
MNRKLIIRLGAILLLLGVVLGAFASHGLKAQLSTEQLTSFQTGVRYQFIHGIALLWLGIVSEKLISTKWVSRAAWAFLVGTIFFSGSIYLLTTRSITGLEAGAILGPTTPIGGILYILGWLAVILGTFPGRRSI